MHIQPNFIDLDYNDNNANDVAIPCYRLQLHRQKRTFAELEPHYIVANTNDIYQLSRFSPGAGSRFA